MTYTPAVIKAALADAVRTAYPNDKTYDDVCPRDFDRPCTLIQLPKVQLSPNTAGLNSVELSWLAELTVFVATDAAHQTHLQELDTRALTLAAVFAAPRLEVEGARGLYIGQVTVDLSLGDAAVLKIPLSQTVARSDLIPAPEAPIMEDISTRYV